VHNARALAELALVTKEIDAGVRDVARLSGEVTKATVEQTQGVGAMVKDADDVRRITKQTARAVAEQADALDALASAATRQTVAVKALSRSTTEQVTATEQIGQAMRDVRGRVREITTALAAQAKSALLSATDVATVAREVSLLREANVEQAGIVAGLAGGGAAGPSSSTDPVA
jgi:methyl-accepting chemotaxis protein